MSKVNDGGPAFPVPNLEHDEDFNGMTLRDYFAAKVIPALLTGAVLPTKEDRDEWLPKAAEVAYEMADVMLRAREE